jgi:3',5'-cyclic AMP phosphodiesterase CpdA
MSARCVIAHLSDLHFGNHDPDVQRRLIDDLVNVEPRPDFIVVTGDLSEGAKKTQLEDAQRWLDAIVGRLYRLGHEARYVVIPGNHDVGRRKTGKHWLSVFSSAGGGSSAPAFVAANTQEYHKNQGTHLRLAEKLAANDYRYCEYYPEFEIAFLKCDSNKPSASWWRRRQNALTFWWWHYANGCVRRQQMQEMRDAIDHYEKAFPQFLECRRIALVHHHVHYLPDGTHEKFLLMEDAGPFWKTMLDLGVELILHGHKHYATNAVIRYLKGQDDYLKGQDDVGERELMILAGGTASSHDLPERQQHCYYRIEANPFKCAVRRHLDDEPAFKQDSSQLVFRTWTGIEVPGTNGPVPAPALDSILVSDDDDIDRNHYRRFAYSAFVDGARGYRLKIVLEGTNNSDEPCLHVPLVIIGARGRTFKPLARVSGTNDSLTAEVILHYRNVDKLWIRISLPAGVDKGDPFAIEVELSVANLMWGENDYDAVGLSRFVGGIETFEYEIETDLEFIEPRFFIVKRRQKLTKIVHVPTIQLNVGKKRCSIKSTDPRGLALGVLLHYRRLA